MPSGRIAYATSFSQIVDGVTYMHTGLGLLHCDLKPQSVLAKHLSDGFYAVKVADLGSAVEANQVTGGVWTRQRWGKLGSAAKMSDIRRPRSP